MTTTTSLADALARLRAEADKAEHLLARLAKRDLAEAPTHTHTAERNTHR